MNLSSLYGPLACQNVQISNLRESIYSEREPAAEMGKVNLLASTVSSKILAAIAGKEGALFTACIPVLTG